MDACDDYEENIAGKIKKIYHTSDEYDDADYRAENDHAL